jgi:hypothetical protein
MFLAAVVLSIGSTAILFKVLEDMGRMESTSAILMIYIYTGNRRLDCNRDNKRDALRVVSGSFEFGEIMVMTIGRIGLFIGGTIFCVRRSCRAPIILTHRQAGALRDNYHFFPSELRLALRFSPRTNFAFLRRLALFSLV